MSRKKITFKQRIRRADQKERHKVASGMRRRMGVTRRSHNRADRIDDGSRPMEALLSDIAEGTAVPAQEFGLDPRTLTDLLMLPTPAGHSGTSKTPAATPAATPRAEGTEGAAGRSAHGASTPRPKPQLPTQLPADHPLALADLRAVEEEERRRRSEQAALVAQRSNKNQYRHAGQPYVFWERVGLHPSIVRALRRLRFSHPTPVQQEVLAHVLDPSAEPTDARKSRDGTEGADGGEGERGRAGVKGDGADPSAARRKRSKSSNGAGSGAGAALSNTQRDVIVSAETGSGKTLVFAIPILNHLLATLDGQAAAAGKVIPVPEVTPAASEETAGEGEKGAAAKKRPRAADDGEGVAVRKRKKHTEEKAAAVTHADANAFVEDFSRRVMHTLIISPTRELAIQINDAFQSLIKFCPHVSVGCIVGGMAQEKQQRVLNRHPHILICTPGRLWDLVEKNEGCYLGHSISRRLHYVVLDEADKLLQSGKFEQLQVLLERIHCDTLPAGFVQAREEGAEVGELAPEAGRWDEVRKRFVPFTKEELAARAKKRSASGQPSGAGADEGQSGKHDDGDGDEEGRGEESAADAAAKKVVKAKDQPRPMPMPSAPRDNHRVITYVTSATLSLQSNYERRDLKSDKKIIRTNNADVMGKVLQQLEIKPSNANVFALSPQADVAAKINETYLRCPDKSKELYMYYFLRTYQDDRTIIFVNAISMLRRLVKVLECLGIAVVGLHASMQQRQRLKFIEKFKSGAIKVLVATDVASRGLDIDGLKYVMHFQVPRTTEAYIHRCGRTARCGGTGLSLLLVNAQEHVSFKKLMESLGRKESDMETFALQPTVVHQLNAHLRIALQIDKLQKEIDKTRASDRWVDRMNRAAELDVDDMKDEQTAEVNREKTKAIRILKRELELLQKKFTGSFGGKGAFRTGAQAVGARMAEEKLRLRADRQALRLKK